jgi:predicted transcriptional regulator
MAPDELEALITELKAWCREERGRQRKVADALGVSEALVSNWLARRKTPMLRHWLELKAFLKTERRRKRKSS